MRIVQKMKVVPVLLVLVIVCSFFLLSGPDFLPFLKYRQVRWHYHHSHYSFQLLKDSHSSGYLLIGGVAEQALRIATLWLGESDTLADAVFHGYTLFDSARNVLAFDSTFIAIRGSTIVPKKTGETFMLIRYPHLQDTIPITIYQRGSALAIKSQERSFECDY